MVLLFLSMVMSMSLKWLEAVVLRVEIDWIMVLISLSERMGDCLRRFVVSGRTWDRWEYLGVFGLKKMDSRDLRGWEASGLYSCLIFLNICSSERFR